MSITPPSPLPFNNLHGLYSKPYSHVPQFSDSAFNHLWSKPSSKIKFFPKTPSLHPTVLKSFLTKPGPLAYTTGPLILGIGGYQIMINEIRGWKMQFGFYDSYFGGH